jgi:hypothetical protein
VESSGLREIPPTLPYSVGQVVMQVPAQVGIDRGGTEGGQAKLFGPSIDEVRRRPAILAEEYTACRRPDRCPGRSERKFRHSRSKGLFSSSKLRKLAYA